MQKVQRVDISTFMHGNANNQQNMPGDAKIAKLMQTLHNYKPNTSFHLKVG